MESALLMLNETAHNSDFSPSALLLLRTQADTGKADGRLGHVLDAAHSSGKYQSADTHVSQGNVSVRDVQVF